MKKLSILLVLCLLVGLLTAFPVAADGGVSWSFHDGVLTFSGTGEIPHADFFDYPEWYYDYGEDTVKVVIEEGITEIGSGAFLDFENLVEVEIADSVTCFGMNAFCNTGLNTIRIPKGVETIRQMAFSNCHSLTAFTVDPENPYFSAEDGVLFTSDMTTLVAYPMGNTQPIYEMPDSVAHVQGYAFSEAWNLGSIAFSENLLTIGDEAFHNCLGLVSLELPEGLQYIGGGAFQDCEHLAELSLPSTLTKICALAFENTRVYHDPDNWVDGLLYLGNYCITGMYMGFDETGESIFLGQGGHITVRPGTTLVASEAFSYFGDEDITGVTLPASLRYINQFAFCYTDISEVAIPDNVEWIDEYAFWNCKELASVTLGSGLKRIGSKAFEGTPYISNGAYYDENGFFCDGKYLLGHNNNVATNIVIPEGIEVIADSALCGCGSYKKCTVTFPASLKYIGQDAFVGTKLTDVTIPETVLEIGDYAVGYQSKVYDDYDGEYTYYPYSDLVIQGARDSAAHHYAQKFGFAFGCREHSYSNKCDKDCNVCGEIRVAYHTYSGNCDRICDICSDARDTYTSHSYTYLCDTACGVCGEEREAEHIYDNDCDVSCNSCGGSRPSGARHSFGDNGFCTVCSDVQPAEYADGAYQIGNAGQLYWFAANGGNADAILTADIVVNENVLKADGSLNNVAARPWMPIPSYHGTFDGNGHTISGLYCVGAGNVGLFGLLTQAYQGFEYPEPGVVKDLGIVDSYFYGSGIGVGAFAGESCGVLEDCWSAATVVGDSYIGGLVGWARGSYDVISPSVTGCYNTGMVTGNVYAGGIVGCITESNLEVKSCYNAGAVTGGNGSGGIAGFMDGGILQGCFNMGIVTGEYGVGQILGQRNADGDVSGCYYLTGDGIGDDSQVWGEGWPSYNGLMTAEQFASGEAAWRMNQAIGSQAWYQSVGTEAYPDYIGAAVYSYFGCDGKTRYFTNEVHLDGVTMEHDFVSACDVNCGTCGLIRWNADHTYSADCDSDCDLCGYVRAADAHTYDNVLDTACNACGSVRPKHVGKTLVKLDGVWHYVVDGELSEETTLVKYAGAWYYVKNGVKCTDNTLVKYNGKWYHVNGGKLVNDTTLVKYNGVWYYVKNGVKCTDNTLVKFNGAWYHVNGGKQVRDTTLVKYAGEYYYVKNGVKCNDNTLVEYYGKMYHVNGGKMVRDTTLVKCNGVWYYVNNGVLSNDNTLVKYNGAWYHVNGGKLVNDTTLVKYAGKWYYVNSGKVDYTFSGKVLYKGTWYQVKKGVKV